MSENYTTSELATMAVITRGIDMDSAERALELALIFDDVGYGHEEGGELSKMKEFYDAADLLRWAAEVMKAEPKMLLGKEIIIKPTPPNLGDNNG